MASLSLDDRGVAPIVDWQEAQRRQDAADRKKAAENADRRQRRLHVREPGVHARRKTGR